MSAQQGTGTYVEVVPLTLHIGAEIRGVDLSKPLPPEQVKEVRDAFLKWKVVGNPASTGRPNRSRRC